MARRSSTCPTVRSTSSLPSTRADAPSADEILGLRGDADAAAIKKAYRKAAIRWHPDKNIGDDQAAAKFQEISEAYA